MFFLKDTTEVRGELIGLHNDSIFFHPIGYSNLRAIWYRDVESIVFLNKKSPWLNGMGGMVAGALLGATGGLVVGTVIDGYRIPNSPPGIISAEHSGGWGGLIGAIGGFHLGVVVGLIMGVSAGSDRVIWIDDFDNYLELNEFARYPQTEELIKYRGY